MRSLNGVDYFSTAEVLREAGISRQTLWRWRHEGFVPLGTRFRDKYVYFTADELVLIKDYANRLQPIETVGSV